MGNRINTQVQLSREFGYFNDVANMENQVVRVRKMFIDLSKSITNKTIDHISQITHHP